MSTKEVPLFPAEAEGFAALQHEGRALQQRTDQINARWSAAVGGVLERAGMSGGGKVALRQDGQALVFEEAEVATTAEAPPAPPTEPPKE